MTLFQVSGPGASRGSGRPSSTLFLPKARAGGRPEEIHEPGRAILGLANFGRMLASIPGGLFQLAQNAGNVLIPGDQGEGEFFSQFARGAGRSLINTVFDVGDLLTLGLPVASKLGQAIIPGEDWDPEGLANRIGNEGLLNVLTEDIGNIALGAGALAKAPALAARAAEAAGQGARIAKVAEAANVARGLSPFAEGARALPAGRVTRGIGEAGALEQSALRIGRYARPYREFIFPAARKVIGGGEFRLKGRGGGVVREAERVAEEPAQWYHGTYTEPGPSSQGITFLGTPKAATDRLAAVQHIEARRRITGDRDLSTLTEDDYLDLGDQARKLIDQGAVEGRVVPADVSIERPLGSPENPLPAHEAERIIGDKSELAKVRKNHDAIYFVNNWEDPGSVSLAVLDSKKVSWREPETIAPGPFDEAFTPPPAPPARTGRAFNWPGLPGGRALTDMFDTGRIHKPYVADVQADARGAVFNLQQQLVPFLDRFVELTPSLSREARDVIIGEQMRHRGQLGGMFGELGEQVFRGEKSPTGRYASGKEYKASETRYEGLREYRNLTPEQRAEVDIALADETVDTGLNALRDAYSQSRGALVGRAKEESMFGDVGLTGAKVEGWEVGDTADQAKRRAEAEAQLAAEGNQQSLFGAELAETAGPGPRERIAAIDLEKQRRPSRSAVPKRLQPLALAIRDMRSEWVKAYTDSGMSKFDAEAKVDADGWTWDAMTAKMQQTGFDPAHFSDLTDDQVRSLIRGQLANSGNVTMSPARKPRAGAMGKTASHSLEAVAAGFVTLSREIRLTEFLRNLVDSGLAQRIPEGGLPPGYRRFSTDPEGMQRLMNDELDEAGDWMVPKHVASYLRTLNKDFSHPLLSGLQRITNPWRALILTASPKWYFNNAIGNAIMATTQGVRLGDWKKAWDQKGFKLKDLFRDAYYLRYPDVDPHLKRSSLAYEGVAESTVGGVLPEGPQAIRRTFREGRAAGASRRSAATESLKVLGERAQRMNEVVDEVARVALYEKELRSALKGGAAYDEAAAIAVDKATKGLVDYTNLTSFERQFVRTIIPFYAWQKGIMQMAARLAIDHPARVRMTMVLGQVNNEMFQEEEAELPDYLRGVIDVGPVNLRTARLNPFADAPGILDPDKVKESLSPYIDLILGRLYREDPTGGFGPKELSAYGRAVPKIDVPGRFLGDILGGTPAARLGGGVFGLGGEQQGSVPQQVFNFLGPSTISDAQLAEKQAQRQRYEEQVTSGAPLPPRTDQGQSGTGSLFTVTKAPASRQRPRALRSPVTFGNALRLDRTL